MPLGATPSRAHCDALRDIKAADDRRAAEFDWGFDLEFDYAESRMLLDDAGDPTTRGWVGNEATLHLFVTALKASIEDCLLDEGTTDVRVGVVTVGAARKLEYPGPGTRRNSGDSSSNFRGMANIDIVLASVQTTRPADPNGVLQLLRLSVDAGAVEGGAPRCGFYDSIGQLNSACCQRLFLIPAHSFG